MSGDRERFLRMGMSGYTSKPIDRDALLAEMSRVLGAIDRKGGLVGETGKVVQPSAPEAPHQDFTDILSEIDRLTG
jgi:hypothetical protein